MDKLKFFILGIVLSVPASIYIGFKLGEESAAAMFTRLSSYDAALYTKTFTKMGVLLHDQELERLGTYISAMAHNSYGSMVTTASALNREVDAEANDYFNSNKSKLSPQSR